MHPSEIPEEKVLAFFKEKLKEINDYIEYIKLSPYKIKVEQKSKDSFVSFTLKKEIIIPYFTNKCKSS